ncbi:MAG: hypothetical protein AABZ55_10215 [Bdellovibrionota bacterium]
MKHLLRFYSTAIIMGFALAYPMAHASQSITENKTEIVTLQDVVKKIGSDNYLVLENALRVYQAKEAIAVARGNLLPKLNLWRLLTIPFDPSSVLGLVEDIAPFLVPANWFRLEEAKILFLAQKEGYRALWSNELLTAKSLYVHALMDQIILNQIQEDQNQLTNILIIVKSRETFGGMPQGTSRDIEVRLLALKEDQRSMEVLLGEETNLLSYMMGLPATTDLIITPVELPDYSSLDPLNYADFEFRAIDSSPEIRQFEHLIAASDYVTKEVTYAFLGASSMSRGVAGGIFDSLPSQQGLGFGTGASIRISQGQKEILKIQKKGVEETVKRSLKLLVNNYNLDLESYRNLGRRAKLTNAAMLQLYERLKLGENIEPLSLIEASRNQIQGKAAFLAVQIRFLMSEDKLARLIFYGDYNLPPATIESLEEKKP